MPRSTRWRWEVLLGLVLAAALFAGGAGALWFVSTIDVHPGGEAIPSRSAAAPAERFAEAAENARRLALAMVEEGNLPGLSVAVGADGEIVWAEGFGWADLDRRAPVTPETRFRTGTGSTMFTLAAVGRLVEMGQLALDEEVQVYVPEVPKVESPVTLRQLMGYPAEGDDESTLYARHCARPVDALRFFSERALRDHSRYAWIAVSAAVEAAAGVPFLTFVEEQVFRPLTLDDTRPDSITHQIPDRSTFYFPRVAADPRYGQHLMRPLDLSCPAGAEAFLSTPSDLVRFGQAMASGAYLQPSTVQALGWDGAHDGDSLGGNVMSLRTLPQSGIVVAVVSNISYADTGSLAQEIAEAFAK